jgi:hypothetical protein
MRTTLHTESNLKDLLKYQLEITTKMLLPSSPMTASRRQISTGPSFPGSRSRKCPPASVPQGPNSTNCGGRLSNIFQRPQRRTGSMWSTPPMMTTRTTHLLTRMWLRSGHKNNNDPNNGINSKEQTIVENIQSPVQQQDFFSKEQASNSEPNIQHLQKW